MNQSLGLVSLVVKDYDEALRFYIDLLGFQLVEDTYIAEQDKRWVVVTPPGSTGAQLLLARAVDGYAFFIGMGEVAENESLLLACQGKGEDASCDIVGAENAKAWVRGISELTVIGAATLEVSGKLENPAPYDPDDWQFEMDSVRLDVGNGPQKLQGVPLGMVLESMSPSAA